MVLGYCRLSVTFGVCKFILLCTLPNGLNLVFTKQKRVAIVVIATLSVICEKGEALAHKGG